MGSSPPSCMAQSLEIKRLAGRRALITGGGRGIGKAIALLCAEEGADVAILSRTKAELQAVKEEAALRFGSRVLSVQADVTKEAEVATAVSAVVAELGGIDLLINNAGGTTGKGPLHEQLPKDFRRLLDLNVVSVLIVTSAVLRQAMLKTGRGDIVNVSSRAGKIGIASAAPYCASKFAVEGLTATLAEELRGTGVRVNSISPGMVDTATFPKPPGRKGVRTAESVKEGFLTIVESGETGMYLHVDEYDTAVAAGSICSALKPINEPTFDVGR